MEEPLVHRSGLQKSAEAFVRGGQDLSEAVQDPVPINAALGSAHEAGSHVLIDHDEVVEASVPGVTGPKLALYEGVSDPCPAPGSPQKRGPRARPADTPAYHTGATEERAEDTPHSADKRAE